MAAVQEQVESHYRSDIVDKVRRTGGIISVGDVTVRLAKQFGFCYGVERAIDLAYAARKVFKDRRLFIVGEIIHNPEVNEQISSLGIKNLTGENKQADISDLEPDDVVIVPAFGTELVDPAADQGSRLPDRGHDLRRRDERLETGAQIRQRIRHLDHSRQGRARRNQGDQLARARRRQGTLSRRAHARGHRLRLRLHPARRRQAGVSGEIPRRAIRQGSIPMCI